MQNIVYHIVIVLMRLLALLPFWLLYGIADVVALVLRGVVGYRRKVVEGNIERAFPDKSKDEQRRVVRLFYRHLADIFVETVKLLHFPAKTAEKRIEVVGGDCFKKAEEEHRPVVLLMGHIGNWEVFPEVSFQASPGLLTAALYRPLKSKLADRVTYTIRKRLNTVLIDKNKAVRAVFSLKQQQDTFVIAFIADQRPTRRGGLKHWTTFMGQETPYMAGAEEIGRRIAARYVYMNMTQPRRGHYKVELIPVDEQQPDAESGSLYPVMEDYYRLLEQNIRQQPELYLWSHNRWKYGPDMKPKQEKLELK